ncbi:MAG: HDOD domain-containing protein [Mariprofundus sp.]
MQDVFIGRQAIFDRNGNVSSYELLFRSADNKFLDDGDCMTAKVLVAALMDVGLDVLAGDKRANINASESFLLSGVLDMLPPERVGIEVLETVPPTDEVLAACRALKENGYTLLLDDVIYEPRLDPLLELADVIKVDLPFVKDLTADVKILRRFKGKLLAEKVETRAEYDQAYALGFDYFQGYFFCNPDILKGSALSGSKFSILRALQRVMSATDVSDIQHVIKQDVNLSYRLLKYINSASFALRREVESIEQALVMLGLNNTRRWLTLLSLASMGEGKPSELLRTALFRGYLLESIAKFTRQGDAGDDFLLGMFSVIDALLDKPMADLVAEIALPAAVRDALLHDDAKNSFKLQLVKALEHSEWDTVVRIGTECSALTMPDLMRLYTQALVWSDEQMKAIAEE